MTPPGRIQCGPMMRPGAEVRWLQETVAAGAGAKMICGSGFASGTGDADDKANTAAIAKT